jgi:valyl-tRNA synthetase
MAIKAIKNKEVEIVTEKFEKIFMHWMENLRDWPVSRQIWWGIPIPVKYCADCKEIVIDTEDSIKTCPKCQSKNLEKDPDTFDTWFSSGQWPYATLMANDAKRIAPLNPPSARGEITADSPPFKGGVRGGDFDTYFPTQVMETGWDILFFWVARMIMMSYYRTDKPPFEKVYLHGLVRDKDRQKMSKSKGNVIDPLGVIDTYGCDALRFALIFSTSAGNDIPLAEDKIKGMKHFANKLWNIARFILANIDDSSLQATSYKLQAITDADKEILTKLNQTIKNVTEHLENFRLHEAAQDIYQFTWHELADIYVEASKKQLADENLKENTQKLLLHNLINVLKLLHPFMPFITEELWGILGQANLLGQHNLLMVSNWPTQTR